MNSSFNQIIAADQEARLGVFTTTAQRLGTIPQNVEKDFWVCWTQWLNKKMGDIFVDRKAITRSQPLPMRTIS